MTLNRKLIADLANLATRYRPKDWEELSRWLDNPEHRKRLQSLLLEAAIVSQDAPRRSSRKPAVGKAAVTQSLAAVRQSDPARADVLDEIWLKLREREFLPTLAAIRDFANATGFKRIEATRRDQAVTELMVQLISLPAQALEGRLHHVAGSERQLGDEYEHWVRQILGRTPGERDAAE